jgi:hypothetical protein
MKFSQSGLASEPGEGWGAAKGRINGNPRSPNHRVPNRSRNAAWLRRLALTHLQHPGPLIDVSISSDAGTRIADDLTCQSQFTIGDSALQICARPYSLLHRATEICTDRAPYPRSHPGIFNRGRHRNSRRYPAKTIPETYAARSPLGIPQTTSFPPPESAIPVNANPGDRFQRDPGQWNYLPRHALPLTRIRFSRAALRLAMRPFIWPDRGLECCASTARYASVDRAWSESSDPSFASSWMRPPCCVRCSLTRSVE